MSTRPCWHTLSPHPPYWILIWKREFLWAPLTDGPNVLCWPRPRRVCMCVVSIKAQVSVDVVGLCVLCTCLHCMCVSAAAEQQLKQQWGRWRMCSRPAMAHKDNWPENTWTSLQGPTWAIISPRGTICKMNTLIKTAESVHMCMHVRVRVCVHTYARTWQSQFRGRANIWQRKRLSFNQSVMCCLWCLTLNVHSWMCVFTHSLVEVSPSTSACVPIHAFVKVCVCIRIDLCVCVSVTV